MLVNFYDQSSGTQPYEYLWDFGDGITSIEQSAAHLYFQPGLFTVTLTIIAPCGTDVYRSAIRAGSMIYMPITLRH
jgi:PKD repeat protein